MDDCLMNTTGEAERISVIIPVYNAEKYIDECLDSVTKQSYRNLEIILENDGSTDTSLVKCQAWQKRDHRIRLESHENWGVSKSRNDAIQKATGKYLVFVDADDVISSDFVQTLVFALESTDSQCAVVNTVSGSSLSEEHFTKGSLTVLEDSDVIKALFHKYQGYLWNKIFLTNIIRTNKLSLDENTTVMEDMIFNVDYMQHCKRVAYDDGVKYFYRQQGESAIYRLDNIRWFDMFYVYDILLDRFHQDRELYSLINFRYCMVLLEAKARLPYIKEQKETIAADIAMRLNKVRPFQYRWSAKQWGKVILYRLFPQMVLKYQRRMLRT